ncbi:MAG: hypothetical protein ABI947_00575 [Chloroflexota bacterium]
MRLLYGFLAILTASLLLVLSSTVPIGSHAEIAPTKPNQGHTWIAFTSYRDGLRGVIYVMAPDGSDVHRLTDASENDFPIWSPDGKKIAFESLRFGYSQIYVMDADGTNQVNVSNNGLYEDSPSWTPDGKHIVFESSKDKYAAESPQFYVMDADGSNRFQITGTLPIGAAGPVLSPDGKQIAFVSHYGGWAIYIMDSNGKNVQKLIDEQLGPTWSPDSTLIASYGALAHLSQTIYVTNVRTGENQYLTDDSVYASSPSWSPDGKHIVFSSFQRQSNKTQIYVMNSDGSQQINISNNNFFDDHPAWSPVAVTISDFPIELTPIPTLLPTATESCDCTETNAAPDPQQRSTFFAQASAILSTVTALARETMLTPTPYTHTRDRLDATQTAIRGTLVIQRTSSFATFMTTAQSTDRP